MTITTIRFLNLVLAGLIAGILVGIWLGYNPTNYSFTTYLEQQQGAIRALNTIMPLVGQITIILTLFSALKQKTKKPVFIALISAAILLVAGGLVTKFGNQPINQIVMTWSNTSVPDNWTELRDKWWLLHKIRAVATCISFCLIVWTAVRQD